MCECVCVWGRTWDRVICWILICFSISIFLPRFTFNVACVHWIDILTSIIWSVGYWLTFTFRILHKWNWVIVCVWGGGEVGVRWPERHKQKKKKMLGKTSPWNRKECILFFEEPISGHLADSELLIFIEMISVLENDCQTIFFSFRFLIWVWRNAIHTRYISMCGYRYIPPNGYKQRYELDFLLFYRYWQLQRNPQK